MRLSQAINEARRLAEVHYSDVIHQTCHGLSRCGAMGLGEWLVPSHGEGDMVSEDDSLDLLLLFGSPFCVF